MALIHDHSCECVKTELDLFTVPPTQTSIEKGRWEEVNPLAHIIESGPIEFVVPGTGDEYIDLASCLLYVKAKITNADGSNLLADAPVGPVNLWLHSLFSQIDVYINGKMVSNPSPTYPYRALLETILTYGIDAKSTQLGASLYAKDTASNMDVVNPLATDEDGANAGLRIRHNYTSGSKIVDMIGPIHSDMFSQSKYMMNGIELRLKLNRSKSQFCLVSPAVNSAFKAVIPDATFLVRKVKISPSVQLAHAEALNHGPAKYPIQRSITKVISIPGGTMSLNKDHIFLGQLPKRVVVGLVDNDAFNGSYDKNPFNFKNYGMTSIVLSVGGEQVPSKPLKLDFNEAGPSSVMGYYSLFQGTNKMHRDEGNTISRTQYNHGYTLFAFDLTPDLSANDAHLNLVQEGNLGIEIQFAQALDNTVNVLVYGELDNIIEIDRDRNVMFDF